MCWRERCDCALRRGLLWPAASLYKAEPLSSFCLLKGNYDFSLSHIMLWSFNFNHSFLSRVVSSEAGVKTLWEALAPDLQESVCELVSVSGRETKNRKRANKAQIVPVVLINGQLSSRCWERQNISNEHSCNTRTGLIFKQSGTNVSVCCPLCAMWELFAGYRKQFFEQSLRLLFWVPGSVWYAITSTWSEWWIEAWLRPPHLVSPEKGLRFLTMETVSTSPKQPPNLCICLTHFSPILSSLKILLCSSAGILHLSKKVPRSFLVVRSGLAPKVFTNVAGLTQRLKSSSSSNSSSSTSLSTSDTP